MDFEAFQHGQDGFILKELCIIDSEKPLDPLYYIFKPPVPWDQMSSEQQHTFTYEEQHLHHLKWAEGKTRYCCNCVLYHIERAFPLIYNHKCYVLGRQKMEFLQCEFPELDIVDYSAADSFKDLSCAPLISLVCFAVILRNIVLSSNAIDCTLILSNYKFYLENVLVFLL